MNRRGFVGTTLAGLGGFFFPRKSKASDELKGFQYLVTVDIDESQLRDITEKHNKPYNPSNKDSYRRSIENLLKNNMGYINRYYPGLINIDVK